MSKTVVINLGSGDLNRGFPQVTARLWTNQHPQPEQFIGSLPPSPDLIKCHQAWQSNYLALCNLLIIRSFHHDKTEDLEIEEGGITQVSQVSFQSLSQQLQQEFNVWLHSEGFLNIDRQLRSQLDPTEEIRVVLESDNDTLRRLPWQCWDFLRDYSKAEMALSCSEYKRRETLRLRRASRKVRILAVLGTCKDIDAVKECEFFQAIPDAEVVFLLLPLRQQFNEHIWDAEGWDILFFAGHSRTEGETGRLYINENPYNNSLTIEQLEEALSGAIDKGLNLAIFNSCDGVGLAQALGKLQIPQVIVMREPVPNRVAQEFLRYFLDAFAAERLPLYLAVRQARQKLQGLEDEFPGASWIPIICQNPAVEPSTWLQLGGLAPCPYRGLFAFQAVDAHLFFGREQVTDNLMTAVKRKALVAVIGSSGSGKSSLVFAGLVPRLLNSAGVRWHVLSFRPGSKPFDALADAFIDCWMQGEVVAPEVIEILQEHDHSFRLNVLELALDLQTDSQMLCRLIERQQRVNPETRLLLIVDQFEELYTLCPETDRQPFLDSLLNAVQSAPSFTLVLTLRADFYGYALSDRRFSDALQGAVYNLGPMSREELQTAITQPAAQMQVKLEQGLMDKLVQATWGHAGRLPLLEFTLTELWSQQQAGYLTHQAYDAMGGVEEALANHAERVYAQLHPIDQQRVQRIFVQLVEPGVGTNPSRRLATRDEVGEGNWDLVSHLASARLVVTNRNEVTGEETVEIVHEALIRGWGRLEAWLQVDDEFRRWQEDLRWSRRQWEDSACEDDLLLRGKRLADAKDWFDTRQDEMSPGERQFIQRSLTIQERDDKQRRRRRRLIISGLIAGLLTALTLAGVASWGWQNAAISEVKALSTSSNALFVSNNKLDALIEAIRARKKLQVTDKVNAETEAQVDSALGQAVYGIAEYNRLSWHRDGVKSVAFSPDGTKIASGAVDNTVKISNQDGTLIATLNGHSDKIWQAIFSPDGHTIASVSKDKTIKLWKIEAGKTPVLITTLVGHQNGVRGVAFSPDGRMLASVSDDKTIKLWKRDGTLIKTLTDHTDVVNGVAFSADGQMLASASDDKTVKLWKRDGTLIKTFNGHTGIVNGVAFSPDGQMLASTSWDKTIKLWKLEPEKTPTLLKTLTGHSEVVFGVAFSPDSQTLVSGSWDKTVKLWKRDGTLITTLNGHSDRVWGVSFSPNGETIASASDDKTVKLWKVKSPLLTRLTGHTAVVIGVAFSPDGQTITSTSDDKTVRLWKLDGTPIATLNGHTAQTYEVAFNSDDQTVASASADKTVKLWNVGQSPPRLLTTLTGHQAVIWGVGFSPNSQMVASASWDKTIKIWKIGQKTAQLLTTLKGHSAEVYSVAFSPDSKTIASASADNTIKLWRVEPTSTPAPLTTLKGHTATVYGVVFSPDGKTIASASADNTIKLWKLDGTLLTTLKGHHAVAYSVAFSPDGQTIASASWDKTIKLWKSDGTLLTTLNGYSDRFWGITFSPNGQTIAAANEDKSIILWNKEQVLTLDPLIYGCNWVRNYLKTNPNVSKSDRHLCDG